MSNKRDYYEILEIAKTASADEIKKAYRRLARKYHPDVNRHDENAEEKFKELSEAYEALSDPQKRQMYDQFGHQGASGHYGDPGAGGFGDMGGFGDIFDMFFGGGGRGQSQRQSTGEQGSDLRYDLEITLEEVATGVEKTVRMSRMEPCDTCAGSGAKPGTSPETCLHCHGTGQVRQTQQTILGSFSTVAPCSVCRGTGRLIKEPCVTCNGQGRHRKTTERAIKIPAGVENGSRIRIRGGGDAGTHGGQSGDLYVVIFVKQHKIFERNGDDILYEIPISFVQAALGDTIEVPNLDGTEKLHIPHGTQTGTAFTLRGKGVPNLNSGAHGDEIVVLRVLTPTKLNEEQKRILLEFAESTGVELNPEEGKTFFERLLRK